MCKLLQGKWIQENTFFFFFLSCFPLELSFAWEGRVLIAGLILVLMGGFALPLPFSLLMKLLSSWEDARSVSTCHNTTLMITCWVAAKPRKVTLGNGIVISEMYQVHYLPSLAVCAWSLILVSGFPKEQDGEKVSRLKRWRILINTTLIFTVAARLIALWSLTLNFLCSLSPSKYGVSYSLLISSKLDPPTRVTQRKSSPCRLMKNSMPRDAAFGLTPN